MQIHAHPSGIFGVQTMRKLIFAASVVSATLAIAGPANAGYYVGSYAEQYSPLSGNRNFQGYNFTTDPFFNHFGPGNGGDFVYRACSGTCSASSSGTPDHTGSATASFDFASMADIDQGGPSSGAASAYTDLATGKLGGFADGTYRSAFGGGTGINSRSFSTFGDTLHFLVDGADSTTVTDITVNLLLHGAVSHTVLGFGSGHSYLNFNGAYFDAAYGLDPRLSNPGTPQIIAANAAGWSSYSITPVADGVAFSGVYGLRGASSIINIGEYLDITCGGGITCDFSNTAAFSFNLPSNVSFTSDSGVFLSALNPGTSAVPEPTTWAMMIFDFGLVGSTMRRRAATHVAALA